MKTMISMLALVIGLAFVSVPFVQADEAKKEAPAAAAPAAPAGDKAKGGDMKAADKGGDKGKGKGKGKDKEHGK